MKRKKFLAIFLMLQTLITSSVTPIFAETLTKGEITIKYVDIEGDVIKEEKLEKNLGEIKVYGKSISGYKYLGKNTEIVTLSEDNLKEEVVFELTDIKVPTAKIVQNTILLGETLEAKDFVTNIKDNSDKKVDVYFLENPNWELTGKQTVSIVLEDISGNKKTVTSIVNIIDTDIVVENVTLEAGKTITAKKMVTKYPKGSTIEFKKTPNWNKLGKQKVEIVISVGDKIIEKEGEIYLVDTTAPNGKLCNLDVDIENDDIKAKDLVTDLKDNTDGEIKVYYKERPSFSELGKENFVITLEDETGNTRDLKGSINIVNKHESTATLQEVKINAGETVKPSDFFKRIKNAENMKFVNTIHIAFHYHSD